ncbi:MAG: SRPBCC domain-containing protein [Porticoccaceae bacterium]|nr:SRPBCC domain-containing protein [Porticoccaceae bacterium]
MSDLTLSVSKTINAPIESVFNAWLDPEILAKFMIPGEGVTVPLAESDARVGGSFKIMMVAGDREMPHTGEYIAIDPHSSLIFTWQSGHSVDGSTVSLNFSEVDGGTEVELTQVKFLNEEAREDHRGGWTRILDTLDSLLS